MTDEKFDEANLAWMRIPYNLFARRSDREHYVAGFAAACEAERARSAKLLSAWKAYNQDLEDMGLANAFEDLRVAFAEYTNEKDETEIMVRQSLLDAERARSAKFLQSVKAAVEAWGVDVLLDEIKDAIKEYETSK